MADVTEEKVDTQTQLSQQQDNEDNSIDNVDHVIDVDEDNEDNEVNDEDQVMGATDIAEYNEENEVVEETGDINPAQNETDRYNLKDITTDERLFTMFGFNPKAYCWTYFMTMDDGTEIESDGAFNVPDLQHKHYFFYEISASTKVKMVQTINSGPSICAQPTEISQIKVLWTAIKYPEPTWQIINDNINIIEQFKQFDTNGDGFISPQEAREYWTNTDLAFDPEIIEEKITEMMSADQNMDGKVNYFEFKRQFFVSPDNWFNQDYKIRLSRYAFVIVVPVFCLIILSISPDIELSFLMGISIQLMYIVYFATLAFYFWHGTNVVDNDSECRYLYRVFSRPGTAQIKEGKWAPLRMPLNQIAWPLKAIHSVSEFSAVGGAMPSIMLANIGQYTWAIVTMHFMIQIITNDEFIWGLSDTAIFIGVAGLVMLGVFEADPFNDSVNKSHMLGALLGAGTAVGYILQQYDTEDTDSQLRPVLSWVLLIAFIMFYWLWQVTLSLCFIFESNSWNMYAEEEVDPEEEVEEDEEHSVCWRLCEICCLLTGCPLLLMLCIGCLPMCWVANRKRTISKLPHSKTQKKNMTDFQPSLPFWREDITPKIKSLISIFSMANVLFEGVVLMVGSTALSLWLMDYERVCDGLCFDQVMMLTFLFGVLLAAIWGSYNLFGFVESRKGSKGMSMEMMSILMA